MQSLDLKRKLDGEIDEKYILMDMCDSGYNGLAMNDVQMNLCKVRYVELEWGRLEISAIY